jgi:FlaA1/EpsC-like NDP-sugar epimerase
MKAFKIDTVYHAAAYKHVPLMEQNVLQCISNNVIGTKNMVEISMMNKVQNFILISTDKAVRPTNFMGASKRFAEIICQIYNKKKSNTHFSIVRFGNVLGSSGSVVPLFKEQIFKGGPITLTHLDITRYFMTIPEAAQLVIQASSMSKKGEIFVLDMGKPIKILELAKKMITLAGLKPVVSKKLPSKNGEVSIIVTGLRPGEKLYEEVSYNSELLKTDHPRIMKAVEPSMKIDDFEILLKEIINAIKTNDVALLFQKISSVTDQVSNISNTEDILINSCKQKEKKIIENTL